MLPDKDLLAMSPAQWEAHVELHLKKQARARAWEARLHGLRHKSGRALTAEDFLTKPLRGVGARDAEAVFGAFQAAFAPLKNSANNPLCHVS